MVGKRPNMMMKDELYVDRRIKIFKVKKKGPIFDVKKIAADLKARTTKPVVERTVEPEQTKSDLINSNRIKAFTVHVKKPPVREPRQPIESNPKEIFTITDSSDEDSNDDDLSITHNIHVEAMLSPGQTHSFYVPVDIPCRTEPTTPKTVPTKVPTSPVSTKTCFSTAHIPRRFDCFVNLERLPIAAKRTKAIDMRNEQISSANELTDTYNVNLDGLKMHFRKEQQKLVPPSMPSPDFCMRSQNDESSFDIKVQQCMPSLPPIETPPPEMPPIVTDENPQTIELVNTIKSLEARLKREKQKAMPELRPIVKSPVKVVVPEPAPVPIPPQPVKIPPQPVQIAPKPVQITPKPVQITPKPVQITPKPVLITPKMEPEEMDVTPAPEPQPPPPPPARPVIKLRNIYELLDPQTQQRPPLVRTDPTVESWNTNMPPVGHIQPNYPHAPNTQTIPATVTQMIPQSAQSVAPIDASFNQQPQQQQHQWDPHHHQQQQQQWDPHQQEMNRRYQQQPPSYYQYQQQQQQRQANPMLYAQIAQPSMTPQHQYSMTQTTTYSNTNQYYMPNHVNNLNMMYQNNYQVSTPSHP